MAKIRAFLFDLDGVITDTSEFHFLAWQRLAREEGLPFDRQDNEALRGVGRRESLALILKGRSITESDAAAWMERKNNYYVELVGKMSPGDLLPGAARLLEELRLAGLKIAIVSSSKNTALVLERLQLHVPLDAVVDGSMVVKSKPAPDLFLKAAELIGIPPAECVVVEDATAGIQSGQAAGMLTLGLGPRERVGQADLVLPDLRQAHLADILAGLEAASQRQP
jgi:beta-phosphoglucomutase